MNTWLDEARQVLRKMPTYAGTVLGIAQKYRHDQSGDKALKVIFLVSRHIVVMEKTPCAHCRIPRDGIVR
jgi:hypothetical protein